MTDDAKVSATPKLLAGGGAGALTIIIVWLLKQFGHIEMPTEVAMSLSTIITIATAYITPLSNGK